jgi:hypothetical protein
VFEDNRVVRTNPRMVLALPSRSTPGSILRIPNAQKQLVEFGIGQA